jgi:hypothetical protein
MTAALGVMARAPSSPGKTRLAPHFSTSALRALQRALVSDTLAVACANRSVEAIVFVTPDEAVDEIRALAPRELPVIPQRDGDLGARMCRAMRHLVVDRTSEMAILIGTDVPMLTAADVDTAAAALRNRIDLVLGPADDGGYYLTGMTRVIDAVFEGIEWGSDRVLSQTIAAANRAGMRVQTIANRYDVDTIDDLRRAEVDLRDRPPWTCPSLRQFLATHLTPLA